MHFVLFSVLFSVSVSVVFKLARRYQIAIEQIIVWNYPAAICLCYFVLRPPIKDIELTSALYGLFLPLGILLPVLFWIIARSIRLTGIARTEVAQRISLIIPLSAAFLIFHEKASVSAFAGIALGLLAVLFSFRWTGKNKSNKQQGNAPEIYLISIFLGMGVIDVLFKEVAQHSSVPYHTSLLLIFSTAFMLSFLYVCIRLLLGKGKFQWSALFWGLFLGVLNFGNIALYMLGHRALPENPSLVFTAMNIGVIALGAGVGAVFFKEKLSKLNYLSFILAALSILILART